MSAAFVAPSESASTLDSTPPPPFALRTTNAQASVPGYVPPPVSQDRWWEGAEREGRVRRPDAFIAFAPSSDYARARDVIARPTRGLAWPNRGGAHHPLLPALQCGAPHPDRPGGRCGLSLTPMRIDEGDGYMYTSARCSFGERGHRTSFRSHIERPVLEMLTAAYTPDAMIAAVRAVHARGDAALRELAGIDRAQTARQADYARASELEMAARREGHALDIEHWETQRRAIQASLRDLQRAGIAKRQEMAALSPEGGLERQLSIVRDLTASVPALIARSRPLPGMTRALVRLLTQSLTIRQAAPWVAVLEVEFPNGARASRIVLTGRVSCTQPERALAHYAYALGTDAAALAPVVARLTRPTEHKGPRLLLNSDKVVSLALLHQYFEPVAPRMGPLESLSGLAARVGLSPVRVEAAVLEGALGPAGVAAGDAYGDGSGTDGMLLVAPTEPELEAALHEYARRQVEAREGWSAGDAARMRTLRKTHGLDAGTVKCGLSAHLPGRYAADLAGELYVRLSAISTKTRTRAGRKGGVADLHTAIAIATREAMNAAGYGTSTDPDDWWTVVALVQHLRRTVRVGSKPALQNARKEQRVLFIPYHGPHPVLGSRAPELLIYCPKAVAHSGDAPLVRAWFRGETPRPARDEVAARGPRPSRSAIRSRSTR